MPLVALAPGVHYFPSAVNSVVIENKAGGALLVDTGLDESHARKLLRALEEHGLVPSAILNTHSHADHHGGNAFILKKFPALEIFAPPLEAAIIQNPLLEPLYLYGACPPPELQTKFLLAPPSPARPITAGQHTLGGVTLELLDIPGHAVQMFAVRVGEVLYAADGLFGAESLQKHPLTFCADSAAQKASAQLLGDLQGVRITLPGHGEPVTDLPALAQLNVQSYGQTTNLVLSAVQAAPGTTDELLAWVCDHLELAMANAGAMVLNRAVVSAHLAELLALKQVSMKVLNNKLIFSGEV